MWVQIPLATPTFMTQYRDHTYAGSTSLQCAECHAFDTNHYPGCSSLRPFPVQQGGSIPWWLAEEAYAYYAQQFGKQQSLQHLADRGGFGVKELLGLLRKEL